MLEQMERRTCLDIFDLKENRGQNFPTLLMTLLPNLETHHFQQH